MAFRYPFYAGNFENKAAIMPRQGLWAKGNSRLSVVSIPVISQASHFLVPLWYTGINFIQDFPPGR
jgi:hypothetical protein